MKQPGELLISFLSTAKERVWLVAPFMIMGATKKALDAIPAQVHTITVVTRWRPDDVAAGVSDLGVLDLVARRPGATLLIHPRLHAKVYRADDETLVGSVNLTDTALGWGPDANLEMLVPCHNREVVEGFMAKLLEETFEATDEMRETIRLYVPDAAPIEKRQTPWLPHCASPNELWNVYASIGLANMLVSAQSAGKADLKALDLPPGLDQQAFHAAVTARFAQMRLVGCILGKMGPSVTDAQGMELLKRVVPGDYIPYRDAQKAWDVFKRWLQAFGGGEFRSKSAGEIVVRERLL